MGRVRPACLRDRPGDRSDSLTRRDPAALAGPDAAKAGNDAAMLRPSGRSGGMADATDSKSVLGNTRCGFKSLLRH